MRFLFVAALLAGSVAYAGDDGVVPPVTNLDAVPGLAPRAPAAPPPPWRYAGDAGPAHWGELDERSAVCAAGSQQSPVDIEQPIVAAVASLAFQWRRLTPAIGFDGRLVGAQIDPGNNTILGGRRYEMQHFQLHHPAEHRLAGVAYALEAQFVHRSIVGDTLIIAVLFKAGTENPALTGIIAAAQGAAAAPVDFAALLPGSRRFYRYAGSATVPPCAEDVDWIVFATPLDASLAQIEALAALMPASNRPLQPLHRRFILSSE